MDAKRRAAILREWREKRGWKQERMGAELGVSGAAVSRYESGGREVSGDMMRAWAAKLGETYTDEPRRVIPIRGYVPCGPSGGEEEQELGENIEVPGVDPARTIALRARGDSMSPFIEPGDVLLFRRVEGAAMGPKGKHATPVTTWLAFDGQVVLVQRNDGSTVKRLRVTREGTDYRLELEPFNRDRYAPVGVGPGDSFAVVGVLERLCRRV